MKYRFRIYGIKSAARIERFAMYSVRAWPTGGIRVHNILRYMGTGRIQISYSADKMAMFRISSKIPWCWETIVAGSRYAKPNVMKVTGPNRRTTISRYVYSGATHSHTHYRLHASNASAYLEGMYLKTLVKEIEGLNDNSVVFRIRPTHLERAEEMQDDTGIITVNGGFNDMPNIPWFKQPANWHLDYEHNTMHASRYEVIKLAGNLSDRQYRNLQTNEHVFTSPGLITSRNLPGSYDIPQPIMDEGEFDFADVPGALNNVPNYAGGAGEPINGRPAAVGGGEGGPEVDNDQSLE